MQYNRISADSHVDLCWMPPTLFVDEASAAMKERMTTVRPQDPKVTWTIATRFALTGRRVPRTL